METIAFAITMETDAANYYREQATAFEGHPIARAFEMLVEAELKHQKLLQDYKKQQGAKLEPINLSGQDDIFSNLPDFKNEIMLVPEQIGAYRKALDLEEQSIQLYSKLIQNTVDESERHLLQFLIDEEKKHYAFFEELVTLVERPEEWVENAEFGNREDY